MDAAAINQKILDFISKNDTLKDKSQEEILSVMIESKIITTDEAEQISAFAKTNNNVVSINKGLNVERQHNEIVTIELPSGMKIIAKDASAKYYAADGVEVNKEYFEKQEGHIDIKPSGRYSLSKDNKTRYYSSNGKEINEKYFKQVESDDIKVKTADGKIYNLNKTIEKRISNVVKNMELSEGRNGFIGSAWSNLKNLTGLGAGTEKIQEQQKRELMLLKQFNSNSDNRVQIFKELTGAEFTQENFEKFIKGDIKLKSEHALMEYNEGQDMAVDVTADIISGVAALGIYTISVAAAPVTGGASLAIGFAAAAASGAAIKSGVKFTDAVTGGRKYGSFGRDTVTGAFSGVLAPITAGLGGAAGKTVAVKLGAQAVKQIGRESVEGVIESGIKQSIKTALTNPAGYEYVGGSVINRAAAYTVEMSVDGAVGGAVDNAFKTAYDGGTAEEIIESAEGGFVSGVLLSPIIGGGMKAAGKVSRNFGSQIEPTVNTVLPGSVVKDAVENVVSKETVGDVILAAWAKNADGSDNKYASQLMDLLWNNPSKLKRTLEACKKDGNFDDVLLKMAYDLEINKVSVDNTAAYDGWIEGNNVREEMRTRMLSDNVLNDNNLQVKDIDKGLNGASQLEQTSKYKQLGVPVLNKRTNAYTYIFENLRDASDFNGLRGKNPLSGKNEKGLRFKLQKLQSYGIKTIVDFRAEGECTKVASKVMNDLNIKYVNFPIDDLNWDKNAVKNIGKFLKAVNEGDFFAGCANGQARTDLGMAINYLCNPSAKNVPTFYYNSSSSSRVSVTENLKQIIEILEKDKDLVKDWGWSDYDSFVKSCGEKFVKLKQSLSGSK